MKQREPLAMPARYFPPPTIDEANNACFIVREHRPNNPSGLLKRDSFLPSAINSFLPSVIIRHAHPDHLSRLQPHWRGFRGVASSRTSLLILWQSPSLRAEQSGGTAGASSTARSTRGRYVGRRRGCARCVCDRQNRTTLMKFERADIKHLSGERRLVRPKPPPPVGGGFLSINSRPPCPPAASRCHGSRCCAGRRIRSKRCTMRGHVSQT